MNTTNVFISYSTNDTQKMRLLEQLIEKSDKLTPIIIPNIEKPLKELSDKVIEGIKSSKFFIPIITSKSINTQWINQEIGYAKALGEKIEIIPIIEKKLLQDLKGFIHKGVDLPYLFVEEQTNPKEDLEFNKAAENLVSYIIGCVDSKQKKSKSNNLIGYF